MRRPRATCRQTERLLHLSEQRTLGSAPTWVNYEPYVREVPASLKHRCGFASRPFRPRDLDDGREWVNHRYDGQFNPDAQTSRQASAAGASK